MFGRKARQIANQAIMIAKARKDSHEYLSSIVAKNKQIIALNDTIQEHTQQIEDLRAKLTRAEGSADAAIQAGGVISGQLHAAQDELALKTATIAKLNLDIDDLKATDERLSDALRQARAKVEALETDKQKLSEALRQARIQLDAYAADDERKPGKPGTAAGRRPRLDFGQDVESLINNPIESQESNP